MATQEVADLRFPQFMYHNKVEVLAREDMVANAGWNIAGLFIPQHD